MNKLDQYEVQFSRSRKIYTSKKSEDNEVGIIEAVKDRCYLYKVATSLNLVSINPDSIPIIGLWPYIGLRDILKTNDWSEFFYSHIHNTRLFNKWRRLYAPLGLISFAKIEGIFFDNIFSHIVQALKLFIKTKREKSFDNLYIDNLYVGDLVHASYIRFRETEQIQYDDFFIFYLIFKSIKIQNNIRRLLLRYKVKFYITSFTSYVQHGVAVREMMHSGIQVYSLGNSKDVIKKHEKGDLSHKLPYWKYRALAQEYLTPEMYSAANATLQARFSGEIDKSIFYMRKSAYIGKAVDLPSNIKGVVYLHDFLDSPFDHRHWLFKDLYDWAVHTLQLIREKKLPFVVKPHPNQIEGNVSIINKLKLEFEDLIWLDPEIANKQLFDITDVGVSVFGTILVELAYHDMVGIAAGDHPAFEFDLAYQPHSISDYDRLICSYDQLTPRPDSRDKAINFFATQSYLQTEQEIQLFQDGMKFDWESSKSLVEWAASEKKLQ